MDEKMVQKCKVVSNQRKNLFLKALEGNFSKCLGSFSSAKMNKWWNFRVTLYFHEMFSWLIHRLSPPTLPPSLSVHGNTGVKLEMDFVGPKRQIVFIGNGGSPANFI